MRAPSELLFIIECSDGKKCPWAVSGINTRTTMLSAKEAFRAISREGRGDLKYRVREFSPHADKNKMVESR